MGIAALVLGISSLMFSFVPLLGLVLGVVAVCLARGCHDESQRGMAIGGLTCGIIGLCIGALATLGIACVAVAAVAG